MAAAVVAFVLVGVWSAVLVAVPRLGWRYRRWEFRNPEAVEPSDAALAMIRVGGVVGILVAIGSIVVLVQVHSAQQAQAPSENSGPTTVTQQQIDQLITTVKAESIAGQGDPRTLFPQVADQMNLVVTDESTINGPVGYFDVGVNSQDSDIMQDWCVQVPATPQGSYTTQQSTCALLDPPSSAPPS